MSIQQGDLGYFYSNPAASAGNQQAQLVPAASLGKFIASTPWLGGTLQDLFQNLTGDQNAAQETEYRCIFIANKNTQLTWLGPVAWLTVLTPGGCNVAIGLDPNAPQALNSATPQALTVSTLTTPPLGVVFSSPTSKATGLQLQDVPPGFCQAIWIRRQAINSGVGLSNDGFSLRVEGQSF